MCPQAQKPAFTMHPKMVITLFDSVLQMLGPDVERKYPVSHALSTRANKDRLINIFYLLVAKICVVIEDILSQVGKRHKRAGVPVNQFPYMGQALIEVLEETLGAEKFTADDHEAWDEVYEALSSDIMKSMLLNDED